ncbi:MAG: MFS transporter, partial [Micromonosporaceae bacterium]
MPRTASTSGARSIKRVVTASFLGTALETYDLYLYGTASALIFSQIYFPNYDPAVALLLSLSTFAVSFIARPLGAVVFGHFGDRLGRKNTLYVTLLVMGLSTVAVGLLPTYHTIGVAAPAILVVLRFLQGFGFGGEYSGAVLMIAEHAPAAKRGFYSGLNNIGPAVGFISSTGIVMLTAAVMSEQNFLSWGWR